MRKLLMVASMVTLLLGATTAAMSAGLEGRSTSEGQQLQFERAKQFDDLRIMRRQLARGCKTLKCINKTLRALINANNAIVSLLVDCFRTQGVSQYGDPAGASGYMWDADNDGNWDENTTALDYDAGSAPQLRVFHFVC